MTTAAEKWFNEQQRMREYAEASLRWHDRGQDARQWPVLVEETIQHVVWVDAADQQEAVDRARYDTWDKIGSGTRSCSWMKVESPVGHWDHDRVYEDSGDSYDGLECDAHVETYRWWLRALDKAHQQATADNEDLDGVDTEQRLTCPVCRKWIGDDDHELSVAHRLAVADAQHRPQEAVTV